MREQEKRRLWRERKRVEDGHENLMKETVGIHSYHAQVGQGGMQFFVDLLLQRFQTLTLDQVSILVVTLVAS